MISHSIVKKRPLLQTLFDFWNLATITSTCPSGHTTLKTTSHKRCIDVDTTLFKRHVSTGLHQSIRSCACTFVSVIVYCLKAPYSSKHGHFNQERFNKLIKRYKYDHKMWHLAACKKSVSLSILNWIKRFSSYLWINVGDINSEILPTLIQRYDKKSFHFWSSSRTTD